MIQNDVKTSQNYIKSMALLKFVITLLRNFIFVKTTNTYISN